MVNTDVGFFFPSEIMVFWVFGYGSLVWNPGFDYDEKIVGFIKDYRRVFDLGKALPHAPLIFLCLSF